MANRTQRTVTVSPSTLANPCYVTLFGSPECSSLYAALQLHDNVQHVLGPELFTDMVTEGTALNIGGRLQANTNNNAVRILETKILLLLKFLRKANDVVALGGKRREDLPDIVTLDKTVESFCMEGIYMK